MQLAGAGTGEHPSGPERRPAVDDRVRIGGADRPQPMRDPLDGSHFTLGLDTSRKAVSSMNRIWSLGARLLGAGLLAVTAGCQGQPPETQTTDEAAIRAADAAWLKAVQAKDLDRTVSFYAEDASLFPISAPIATGREAIRTEWSHILAIPGLTNNWRITRLEVSRGGDLAYAQGTYEASFDDAEGKPVTERGKSVQVWKKQADGVWKCVVDISNTDAPPPTHK